MTNAAFYPIEVHEAANRFSVSLPCTQQEVEMAYQQRMANLAAQALVDIMVQRTLGDLRMQANEDRQLLLRHVQSGSRFPAATVVSAPPGRVPSSPSPKAFVLGIAVLAGVLALFLGLGHFSASSAQKVAAGALPADQMQHQTANAHVTIRTSPWSVCYIDGTRVGNVPSSKVFSLTAGSHVLQFEDINGRLSEFPVRLEKDWRGVIVVNLTTGETRLEEQ